MTQARQRADLLAQGYKIPTSTGAYITVPDWVRVEQPDNLDSTEYNAVLYDGNGLPHHRVSSTDLEFRESEA